MVMRLETEELAPELERLVAGLRVLREDVLEMVRSLEALSADLDPLTQEITNLKADVWEDTYTLCGDARCDGYCRTCLEGEEDYEEDANEKYCRRGKR